MILGLSIPAFTMLHTILSLVGIAAGLMVVSGMLRSKRLPGWTGFFLVTTVLTSVTGFFLPRDQVLPSHVVGVISLVVLAIALVALYGRRLAGRWRLAYVVAAMLALYLNCFVAVVQAFLKIPLLKAMAPTGTESPFVVAHGMVLLMFVALAAQAAKSFHPEAGRAA